MPTIEQKNMKKKLTPGKWFGILSFIHGLLSITVSQVIVLIQYEVDTTNLYKLAGLSFGVFTIVWGAVFGKGAIKEFKNNGQNRIS